MQKSYFFQHLCKFCLICLVVGLTLVGCGGQGVADRKEDIIKIGAILPLTGKASTFGIDMRQAIELAVEEVNQTKKSLEILFEDEKCDSKEALNAYNNLMAKNIEAIIGAGCSNSTLAIAPIAEKDQIVLITTSSAAPAISQAGDYIFRNHGLGTFEYHKLAEQFADKLKNVAIIYDTTNDVYVAGEESFSERWRELGGEIKISLPVQGGAVDYKTELLKLKSVLDEINALVLMAVTKDDILFIKQINELGINKPILADKSVTPSDFISSLNSLAEGVTFVDIDFGQKNNPHFWEEYKNRFNEEPTVFAAQSYDTVKILFEIMSQKCQADDTECIKNELYKIQNYPGAAGLTSFDQNGDAQKPLVLKTIKNGEFVKVEE